jgi:anti-sigma regulatory factor (Ser/Thr protein kinase)
MQLFPTMQAPGEARRKLAALGDRMDEDSLAKVRIVVSELLGISIGHGATELIVMSLDVRDGELEGTVADHGTGARAVARAREHRDDSLVLRIIDSLVEDWGTDSGQTRIWFRIAVEPNRR